MVSLDVGTYGDWQSVCSQMESFSVARQFFESMFDPYLVSDSGSEQGFFTGYFEIGLEGSRQPSKVYRYPIYRVPPDVAAYDRKQIMEGALENRGLELLWAKDPVRLYFLHVQGSGVINLQNGEKVRIGFAAKNGREYVSLGKKLIERGVFTKDELTADRLASWMYKNPDEAESLMKENPSYIFFKLMHGEDGPIGGEGVALTPGRSLAVDKRYIPYGVPLWLQVEPRKLGNGVVADATRRLVISQDTGSAIRGVVRGDVFFGAGKEAEKQAGLMSNQGSYVMFLPKGIAHGR